MDKRTEVPDLLTVEEVAAFLRVNPGSVRRWLSAGRMPSYLVGKARLIKRSDVLAYLEKCRDAPGKRGRRPTRKADTE